MGLHFSLPAKRLHLQFQHQGKFNSPEPMFERARQKHDPETPTLFRGQSTYHGSELEDGQVHAHNHAAHQYTNDDHDERFKQAG